MKNESSFICKPTVIEKRSNSRYSNLEKDNLFSIYGFVNQSKQNKMLSNVLCMHIHF